ncbi:MAG: thiamine-phosphate kinase [Noviherbaspirillum sp.]
MLSEFSLISRYFTRAPRADSRADLGIGDDCALLRSAPGMQMAISSDMLVEGRHFYAGADARQLGHKSLAVNLSDLAAMGAQPVGFTLALALPAVDEPWLAAFSEGMFALADQHNCELIGGDTTKGPLTICITIFGDVPPSQALRRDCAQAGDDIWVSGALGEARLALAAYRKEVVLDAADLAAAGLRMHAPTPRVALGLALRGLAHSAIDISDGLVGDLGHILERSSLGATLHVDALPAGPVLRRQPLALRRSFCLAGGDDYELCFTAPPGLRATMQAAARLAGCELTLVGTMEAAPGLRLVDSAGAPLDLQAHAFDHFSTP